MGKMKALSIEEEDKILEEEFWDSRRDAYEEEMYERQLQQEEFDFERDQGERQKL